MLKLSAIRLYAAAGMTGALLTAAPAFAQYRPQPISNPATGEAYHIEFSAGLWSPNADMSLSSESLGIPGSDINLKTDLGLTDQKFGAFKLVLRPLKKHKLRAEVVPITYTQSATISRTIVFNGQRYAVGVPVNSTLDWKAWRFAYEYDAISRDRGFFGIVLDAKYTDVQATLASPFTSEYAHAKAPIPTIGGIARVYVMPNVSITGEVTGATLGWVPESVRKNDTGHYVDVDVYGTVNFTNNFGAQLGYRSLDLAYAVRPDTGSFTLKGIYFGGVVRY